MSRIGKKPIEIPAGVKVELDGQTVRVQGPKGRLERQVHTAVQVAMDGSQLCVSMAEGESGTALQGLTRTLLANMVAGVTSGFSRVLEIHGVGYRAELKGAVLNLSLGYSHPIDYPLPDGISAEYDQKANRITLHGIDKELLGATAAKIRSFRKPEPYKGKGVKYAEERILRKAGKTGKK